MTRKKWAVNENLEDLIKFIRQEKVDDNIQKYLNKKAKNTTYLSHFSTSEYLL